MQKNMADKLRELKGLLDEGLITQEEFDGQKTKLLNGGGQGEVEDKTQVISVASSSLRHPENADLNVAERQDLEKRLSSMGGTGCMDIEPLVVNLILAFFLPFLWVPVVVWVVASIVAHSKRSEARGALKGNVIEVARSSLDTAKTWYGIRTVASFLLWGTEVYGVYLLVKGAAFLAGK